MNVAVLGVGNIGGTMGKKWSSAGHQVAFGTRDANSRKAQALRQTLPSAKIDTVSNALASADVVLVATPHSTVAELVSRHAAGFAGRIVFDATNNFGAPIVNNVATISQAAPTAHVFRAFNSMGWEIYANPVIDGKAVEQFYCGPDNDRRPLVERLIAEIGVHPVWIGGNEMLPIADALGSLWVALVFQRGYSRQMALRLAER